MYDFLDYMIGRGQQNESTSQLKDALLELKKLESSNNPPNPPQNQTQNQNLATSTSNHNNPMPPSPNNPNNAMPTNKLDSSTTPASTKNLNSTDASQITNNTGNASVAANNADNAITPSLCGGGKGGGYDLASQEVSQVQNRHIKRNTIAEQNEMLKHKDFYQQYENGDIVFLDKNGKKHILETQVQDKWLETFGLESITQDFVPKTPSELKNALGKDIKLKMGSLYKLVAQGREEFIPQIKQVLESPEVALKDSDNTILLAKHLKDEDYFVNVSVDKDEAFISISNGI